MANTPATDPAPAPPAPAPPTRRLPESLSAASLGVSLGFGVAAALIVNPLFVSPFAVVLGRSLFLAMLLLLAFVIAQEWPERWRPRWLPRWLLTVGAVGVAAPLGTLVAYLVSVGGSVRAFVDSPPRMMGFVIIAGTAWVLGVLITFGALLRERDARARALTLELELERSRLEKQAVDARLALLQAQIEPHFLFNTLANVQALVESGSPRATGVLQSLVAYLRAAMPRLHDGEPTLGNEVALVRSYLELMQMRMPDRLSFAIDVPAEMHARAFPAMALLTLVENAVHHGIDPAVDGGRIDVGARCDAAGCRAWVADTGVGLSEHAQPGIGLANLRARLQAGFGPGAELRLSENAPHGLRAEIAWPA